MGEKAGVAKPVGTTFALVFSLVATVLCLGVPFGVPAIFLALKAAEAQRAGSADVARKRARFSIVLSALGVAFGALVELYLLIRHMAQAFH